MAITKEETLNIVEVVKCETWKILQVKKTVRVLEDNVEIASSARRYILHPDISSGSLAQEPADVQAIANVLWTDSHKTSYINWKASGSSGLP